MTDSLRAWLYARKCNGRFYYRSPHVATPSSRSMNEGPLTGSKNVQPNDRYVVGACCLEYRGAHTDPGVSHCAKSGIPPQSANSHLG